MVARPACLVATAVGSVLFVVSLPWVAASRSVKHTAHALVVRPARATFKRPMGDLDALMDGYRPDQAARNAQPSAPH